ncbi:MAG: hypothetical protein AB7J35_05075 [Dehalococcoidia bacterium]
MKKKLALSGAATVIGLLGLASVGLAVAQSGDDGSTTPAPGVHAGPGAMSGVTGEGHEEMQDALAKALGISVDELTAELASGKTVADIAAEKGIDLAALRGTMQEAHPGGGHGAGMGPNGMTMGQVPEQMQAALAEALGITVDELKAQLEAGKTVHEIAAENGVDLATLQGTMQGAHAGGHAAGMPFNRTAPASQP